jgi:Zinc knuckle
MVLGAVGDAPVCYYCNEPGHLRKDCYKLHNATAAGRAGGGSHGGRGGRNGGRNHGERSSLNAIGEGMMDVQEVMRLGLAAAANKER